MDSSSAAVDEQVGFCGSAAGEDRGDSSGTCQRNSNIQTSVVVDFVRKNQNTMVKEVLRHGPYSKGEQQSPKKIQDGKRGENNDRTLNGPPPRYHGSASSDHCQQQQKRVRPNYFIAVQVTNLEILENARRIQQSVLENSVTDLKHMIVDVRKSHLTLMVMNLPDPSAVSRAINCLDNECIPSLKSNPEGGPVTLDFEGVSVFNRGSVFFATVKPSPGLDSLHMVADVIRQQMKENKINDLGKGFNPHMTLMKYRWDRKNGKNAGRYVEKEAYAKCENDFLGSQTVSSVQLCQMDSEEATGYYVVDHEVLFC